MRCNICDCLLVTPRYNRDLKTWEPCDECTEVIQDVLNDYKDNAVWAEDAIDEVKEEVGIPPQINDL